MIGKLFLLKWFIDELGQWSYNNPRYCVNYSGWDVYPANLSPQGERLAVRGLDYLNNVEKGRCRILYWPYSIFSFLFGVLISFFYFHHHDIVLVGSSFLEDRINVPEDLPHRRSVGMWSMFNVGTCTACMCNVAIVLHVSTVHCSHTVLIFLRSVLLVLAIMLFFSALWFWSVWTALTIVMIRKQMFVVVILVWINECWVSHIASLPIRQHLWHRKNYNNDIVILIITYYQKWLVLPTKTPVSCQEPFPVGNDLPSHCPLPSGRENVA